MNDIKSSLRGLDGKVEKRFDDLSKKVDDVNKKLTRNLIA